MDIYVKMSFTSTFSTFFVFKHDFFSCDDFTRIAASNIASDDVTHRIFNTDLLYSCAHFIVKTDGKFSLSGGF